MHRLLGACAAVVLAFDSAGAEASGAGPAGAKSWDFTCDTGPLSKDTSRKKLAAALGAANVKQLKTVDDNAPVTRTLLFPGKIGDEVVIVWNDDKADRAHGRPDLMTVADSSKRSDWRGPLGVSLRSTLAEVEAANGKPFTIIGFTEMPGAGQVLDWRGGALGKAMRDCVLGIVFTVDKADGAAGVDAPTASDDPSVRAANPIVVEMSLSFPEKR